MLHHYWVLILTLYLTTPVYSNYWTGLPLEKFDHTKKNNQSTKSQVFKKSNSSKLKKTGTEHSLTSNSKKEKYSIHNLYYNKIVRIKNSNAYTTHNFATILKNKDGLPIIRIALMTTGEFSQYYIKQNNWESMPPQKQKKLINKRLNRIIKNINTIFNRDLGIHLELINTNHTLLFLNPKTDGLSNDSQEKLIYEAPAKINNLLNSNDYDIAQTLSTSKGGISSRGVAFTNRKANGITGHPTPNGKAFNIDLLAHEIAHQLGASHTQNSNCARDAVSAVEPGSGHTIMSYAGICNMPKSNIAKKPKPYFHSKSIAQIWTYLNLKTGMRLDKRQLQPLSNYTIPLQTPFEIDLNTHKDNLDLYTYTCEQMDTEFSVFPPVANTISGPVFTSPTLSHKSLISFPKKELIINNNYNSKFGVLSNIPRTYTFAASARGVHSKTLGTSIQQFKVNVVHSPKFEITSQNTINTVWKTNSLQNITWNVGTTNQLPIHTKNVDILISDDNGKTFHILLKNTPNDGQEVITVPSDINSNDCRLKIKAVGNIYYTINTAKFTISNTNALHVFHVSNDELVTQKKALKKTIHIDQSINFDDLEVKMTVLHSKISDLSISLKNPYGEKIMLWNHNCSKEQKIDVVFKDDEQTIPWGALDSGGEICDQVVKGFRSPYEQLKTLRGNTKGDWQLDITSINPNANITLNNVSLLFNTTKNIENTIANPKSEIRITPNPATTQINVELPNVNTFNKNKIEFFNTLGLLVKTTLLKNKKQQSIAIHNLQVGIYFVKVYNGPTTYYKKIIVN